MAKRNKYQTFPDKQKSLRDRLERVIYEKYSTLEELGEALGISKQTVSQKLDNPTNKFLADLKDKAKLDLSGVGYAENSTVVIRNDRDKYIQLLLEENIRLRERLKKYES